ncbi:MAG: methyltransferase domain-containing protein [candidate division Zixibacteria bacterium]|nr:methyltransferase domain-containing protein [candidate division Zixibacteria bacterium]
MKIDLIRLGGIGDNLEFLLFVKALRRQFGNNSEITFFSRDPFKFAEYYGCKNEIIPKIFHGRNLQLMAERRITEGKADLAIVNQYLCKFYTEDHFLKKANSMAYDTIALPDKFWDEFPLHNYMLTDIRTSTRELTRLTIGVTPKEGDFMPDLPEPSELVKSLGKGYITVHEGADTGLVKAWPLHYWAELCKDLSREFEVIQVGAETCASIPFTTDLRGKTNLTETAHILKNAALHVDTESGMVHLAKAVGTPSVVLFGPTPVHTFGYSQNVNLNMNVCKPCWWGKSFWFLECNKRGELYKECMVRLKPDFVKQAIVGYLVKKLGSRKPEGIIEASFARLSASQLAEEGMGIKYDESYYLPLKDDVDKVLSRIKTGDKVLEVNCRDGFISQKIKSLGAMVIGTEMSNVRLVADNENKKLLVRKGHLEDLPFGSSQFDKVVCFHGLGDATFMWSALHELERVCKMDGEILIRLDSGLKRDFGHNTVLIIRRKV